jgi:hypothetical protein
VSFTIETKVYSKLRRLQQGMVVGQPVGKGYSVRSKPPTHCIIHSTNGPRRPSSFRAEATFIRDSPAIGAEYCVGKGGEIAEIVNPDTHYAWQSGTTIPGFSNPHSLGIEVQNSAVYTKAGVLIWEEAWTASQWAALDWLMRDVLIPKYGILREHIETHRAVALPKGRKPDPSGCNDQTFYAWRTRLYAPVPPAPTPAPHSPSPRFVASWNASGGIWQPDRLTPGFATSDEYVRDGRPHQNFERGVVRANPDNTVSWLLLSEIA